MEDNRGNEGKLGDLLKKVLTTGVTAAFMTEEAARAVLKDLPLPKEMVGGLIENAKTTKTEFVAGVKAELKNYLDKLDISREIDKIAEKYDFEVKATISLKKKRPSKDKEMG
jgi:polyhydroxyalkanoate synthesis regulator phasin